MKELDWDYIVEILEHATEGGTGCSYTLFSIGESQRLLDENTPYGGPTTEERKEHVEALQKFHTHTGVLSDLNRIETWDKPTSMPEPPVGCWIVPAEEFWPKRVTAKGYAFLETLEADKRKQGNLLETIKQFAIARVNKAADLGLEAFVEHLTGS